MKPEYTITVNDAAFILEDELAPDPNPAWRQALDRFASLRDAYLATEDEHILRRIWNAHDHLTHLLHLAGKFPLGQTVMTPGARDAMAGQFHAPVEFLLRHRNGDWGELDEHDRAENERSLRERHRLVSAYPLREDGRLWVITEADRSATTILLPSEY